MAKKEQDLEVLHVGIRDPEGIKRNVLELSKGVIESLKNYENLNSTREEKKEEINKLRTQLREISRLISRLKSALPKVNIKPEKKEVSTKKPVAVKKVKERPKKAKTELEKLEDELADIEKKLDSVK